MIARRYIPVSPVLAGIAIAASAAAHLGVLALRDLPGAVQIEGGGGAQMAVEGTSFADMAQGIVQPVTSEAAPTDEVDPPEAARVPDGAVTPPTAPRATTPTARTDSAETASPLVALSPISAGPVASVAVPGAPRVAVPTTPSVSATSTTAPAAPVASAVRPSASAPVPSGSPVSEPVGAVASVQEAVEEITTPRMSSRPRTRPAAIEERAAEARAAQDAERRARAEAERPSPARSSPAAPRGNAQANAQRGSVGGTQAGSATASGTGQSQAAGNAAASNYPGQVMRRISQQARPRVLATGAAVVRFSVAPGGEIASAGLARSSGSSELDRAATRLVRQAAPFPRPPAGAQRTFDVSIRAR